jgi:hypothetical protein
MATTPGPNPLFQLSTSQVNRSQSEQWKQIIRQQLADTRCASPAFLTEDMDPVTQTVTVQIAIQEQVKTNAGPVWMDIPPIIMVPIIVPRGGGWSLTLPLSKGDNGMLIFCDTCFDFWWTNGQTNSDSGTQKQNEIRRHALHDCGFLPGMWSQQDVLDDYSTDSMQLRSDDGSTVIDVAGSGVTITSPLVIATQNLQVGNGATGMFTTPTGQIVTVQDGIITNIF